MIFVIVVTYNGVQWVDKCFGSLVSNVVPMHIIAIDNGSSDDTVKRIKDKFPEVEVIEVGYNIGFGKANNIGFQRALSQKADYVFLLNQDAWVERETISILLNVMHTEAGFGILSPFHISVKGKELERQFQDFLSVDIVGNFSSDAYMNRLKDVYKTKYINAASWLISKECLNQVGGFDPLYFHYGEDDDYMERVKHFGFNMGIVPAARITHDSNYKNWQDIEWDKNRNMVIAYKQLKKMAPHFRSNVLSYIKTEFDEITSFLLFRKFRKFIFRIKIFWLVIFRLPKIRASYKASFKPRAFLVNE